MIEWKVCVCTPDRTCAPVTVAFFSKSTLSPNNVQQQLNSISSGSEGKIPVIIPDVDTRQTSDNMTVNNW